VSTGDNLHKQNGTPVIRPGCHKLHAQFQNELTSRQREYRK
jgi:hypothetical protein